MSLHSSLTNFDWLLTKRTYINVVYLRKQKNYQRENVKASPWESLVNAEGCARHAKADAFQKIANDYKRSKIYFNC